MFIKTNHTFAKDVVVDVWQPDLDVEFIL